MRRPVLLFVLGTVAVLFFCVQHVWTLLSLLVVDGSRDAISRAELSPSAFKGPRQPLIPKIIHQTWKNTTIPSKWEEPRQSCLNLHTRKDGWEWKLWTDDGARDFIERQYPWFLDTFVNYEYAIERADAIRYFVLDHYGGIYLDMDIGCNQDLEPLLYFPAWLRRAQPTGVSNNIIGAAPGHPFFKRVIQSMDSYNQGWLFPYISVMASTGPLFLSIIWRHWDADGLNAGDEANGSRVRLLFPEEYENTPWSFFTPYRGNTWHEYDAKFIFWLGRNWIMVTVSGFIIGFAVIGLIWVVYARVALSNNNSSNNDNNSPMTGNSSPSLTPPMQQFRSWNVFAHRQRSKNGLGYVSVSQFPV